MKALVIYSSRTGNTRKIAEAIHSAMPNGAEIFAVENAPEPSEYDFIALGFWVNRGDADAAMTKYMEKVRGKDVGLFCTLGAWPDSDHAKKTVQKATERLTGNRVLGSFICQGKVHSAFTEPTADKGGKSPHPMTEERKARLTEAARHPDKADCLAAREIFAGIISKLQS